MNDSDSDNQSPFCRTDAIGRTRTTRDQREAILDAFEAGSLSGPEFARVHGINYQTFATWRQRRKRERGEYPSPKAQKPLASEPSFTLVEAQIETSEVPQSIGNEALTIECAQGISLKLTSLRQIETAVAFLEHWNRRPSAC